MTGFVGGTALAGRFYASVVGPLLGDRPHTAALIGPGSEVLGFDTPRSTDHDWAPRLQLFVVPADVAAVVDLVDHGLPATFGGYPVAIEPGPHHRVVVTDLSTWFAGRLGFDPRAGVSLLDWLATPTQRLAEVTGGAVFHDASGELTLARERLAWYPEDVWRYVLAAQWARIGEEEPFVGRCEEVGDADGARVVAARLTRDRLRLRLLMRRRYPPYSKWLGSAAGPDPGPVALAGEFNALGLVPPIDATLRPFFDRPYLVLGAGRFADALWASIRDPAVRALPRTGAIDQFVDHTPVLRDVRRCREITRAALWR
jgi:Domain of unknown function (DUF4037)